ncbi:zonular occludens toxin [Vibrio sinaloensis]|uniref:zonular occludens toxin domain-containing protein n=1 Tax=Photobacterium sp. (strain ATCC 43367) TaxID=379097 RepID=UPI00057DCE6F|nr:zonular occludens toxin domain-containing protein [Vibrio sinaloensis]KIE18740.1 zonular occludens toxin [Vibrio sinaloensis]
MAVYFRHGSNGAYKSAYAVWFEILPALRNGRLVVTNIEGLKPMETIEKILGEKFPVGAQLIRIFSRSEEGVRLWQNWFSWMPIGALVVIDECQDLYTADVGFKREKAQQRPLDDFLPNLPSGFADLFYSRWTKVDLSTLDEGDTDDTGGTQVDEQGRLLYPFNFYGAFMRHRKYQWDIIMLTPDWTSIPSWLRGCAQEAYSHRSTDTFFRKRKPRIFNHRPNSTKTAPSTKADYASCSSKKIPVDVFALYKSTGTGGFNESKSDISILKSPKFLLAILIGFAAIGKFLWDVNNVFFSDDEISSAQISEVPATNAQSNVDDVSQVVVDNSTAAPSGVGLDSGGIGSQNITPTRTNVINPFFEHFDVFNGAKNVYFTGLNARRIHGQFADEYIFRVDMEDGRYYLRSDVLSNYGYFFDVIDDCLIVVRNSSIRTLVTCPPREVQTAQAKIEENANVEQLESVDIFNLSKAHTPQI